MWLIVWVPVIGLRIAARRGRQAQSACCRAHCGARRCGLADGARPVAVRLRRSGRTGQPAHVAPRDPAGLAVGGGLLLLAPVIADAATMAWRVSRAGQGTAARGKKLKQNGHNARIVSLYAAHPPHKGHGSVLLGQLVRCAPADVWLLVGAADPQIATLYRTNYDFRNWDPNQPLLLERPAATVRRGQAVPGS
jgi:hypothetical protein